ncbi:hypothetical protein VTJ49DRAFT_4892 [Mycothermus thermophilus]|uniref:Copper acquisition factor BIM1-like domain-containing protein n=1 Tax=Humicola insolens TaxID=85995 RepID=A0ABR3V4A9_HUMIN
MAVLQSVLLLALALDAGVMAADSSDNTMGPIGFMWPPDRAWAAEADNTAPCGSHDGVTNRTAFPLTDGKVAFMAKDDSYHAELSISYHQDPKSQSDFTQLMATAIPEIDPGHTCYSVPDQPSSIGPGTNATLQIKVTADFDRPENQTFYACADITFVAADAMKGARIPCFNATDDEDVPAPTTTGIPTDLPGHGDEGPPLSTHEPSEEGQGNNGLSGGAIAGAVVGSVVGLALIVGLGLLFYRERARKKRLLEQRDSARATKWIEESLAGKKDQTGSTAGSASIRMGDLPAQNVIGEHQAPLETERHIIQKTVWTRVLTGTLQATKPEAWKQGTKHVVQGTRQAVHRVIPHHARHGQDMYGLNLSYYRDTFFRLDLQTQFDMYMAGRAPKMTKREVDHLRAKTAGFRIRQKYEPWPVIDRSGSSRK